MVGYYINEFMRVVVLAWSWSWWISKGLIYDHSAEFDPVAAAGRPGDRSMLAMEGASYYFADATAMAGF